jgi:DNA-binding SARP family transcriptional activator
MYNGEYLMGRTYEWAFETKPYVDNICQNITFTLVDKLREAGQKDESYQVLDRYIALDPLREESIAKLMEMYVEDGKKDAAVQIYRNFENKLSEELDILPSPRLRAIIR